MDLGAKIIDLFAPLSHMDVVGDGTRQGNTRTWMAPSWVPDTERRRLASYRTRDSRLRNVRRFFLPDDIPDSRRDGFREYGDSALAVDRLVAATLGNGWTVTVDGAEDVGEPPDAGDRPDDPGDDATPIERQVVAARQARFDQDRAVTLQTYLDAYQSQPLLQARQEALTGWVDTERLQQKLPQLERSALGLGDGIAVLWPRTDGWPRLELMEPDGYFPIIDEYQEADYPDKVHFAWEFDDTVDGRQVRFLRRVTFELVDLVAVDGQGDPVVTGDGNLVGGARPVPWSDTPATRTCLLSDGTWSTDNIGGHVNALDEARAVWRQLDDGQVLHRFDLGIDFLPVIHLPGVADGGSHYGAAITDIAAQILDDVAALDTDLMSTLAFIRDPTIALSGNVVADKTVRPGHIYNTGDRGSMHVLDLAPGAKTMIEASDRLQDRMWSTLRVPAEVVGRVDSSDVASGVTLALSMGPFGQTVEAARTLAAPKYQLLLKFVQRMAQVAGVLEPGATPTGRVTFGSFLPTDRTETVSAVGSLLAAHAISTPTAVAMLVGAGVPVDDQVAEVDRIQAENTAGANTLADALAGHPDLLRIVAERLGVDPPPPTVDLTVDLPPVV